MRQQRFCSHPAATAIPASSRLLASPAQDPQGGLETASGGGFKGRWGEEGDRTTKLLSHPSSTPPKEAERNSRALVPSPKAIQEEKKPSCQLRRDAEVMLLALVLSQDVHGCRAPGTSTGQRDSRGHLFACVIFLSRGQDPFFISSPSCRRPALP